MGRFSTTAKAEARKTRRYFVPGNFKVRVQEIEAYDADGTLCVAVKTEVLESSVDEIQVGESRQVSWPVSKKKHPGAQFFKQFIAACMGIDLDDDSTTDEEWEQTCELVVSAKQPLAGKELYADVVPVIKEGVPLKTKTGAVFTNVDWRLVKAA